MDLCPRLTSSSWMSTFILSQLVATTLIMVEALPTNKVLMATQSDESARAHKPVTILENATTEEQQELIGRKHVLNCALIGTDQCGINNVQRIIGGNEAIPNEFPWMAQLRDDRGFLCGASLIGQNYVLTAAHCLQGESVDLRVVFGSHRLSTKRGVVERKVLRVVKHPLFDAEKGKAHDIALLQLDRSIAFGRTIRPICLPSSDDRYIGHNGTVIGWGHTTLDSPLSDRLVRLNLPIIDEDECRRTWYGNALPHGTLCAGYEDGQKDSCFGDSGSPLMAEQDGIWQQVGIVSWGAANSCALTYGVYVRVTSYLNWITANAEGDQCFNRLR